MLGGSVEFGVGGGGLVVYAIVRCRWRRIRYRLWEYQLFLRQKKAGLKKIEVVLKVNDSGDKIGRVGR